MDEKKRKTIANYIAINPPIMAAPMAAKLNDVDMASLVSGALEDVGPAESALEAASEEVAEASVLLLSIDEAPEGVPVMPEAWTLAHESRQRK